MTDQRGLETPRWVRKPDSMCITPTEHWWFWPILVWMPVHARVARPTMRDGGTDGGNLQHPLATEPAAQISAGPLPGWTKAT